MSTGVEDGGKDGVDAAKQISKAHVGDHGSRLQPTNSMEIEGWAEVP